MVIRLTIGAQIGGALRYNEQKVVQKQAHILCTTGFANDELAAKSRSYARSVLESQAKKNMNVRKPTLHFSLSLHPTEQISDDKFKVMAHQFMAEMGYQNQPYIVYRHHDTAHPHIHIVTTCVNETGKKIDDSFIKRRTNAVRQKLELQFGLIKAQGRGKEKTSEQSQEVKPTQANEGKRVQAHVSRSFEKKDQLEAILRETLQQATFGTIDEYRALLKKKRIRTVLHQSKVGDKVVQGISYQFTDENGKPATTRIKASEVGEWATWKGIEMKFGQPDQQKEQAQSNRLTNEQYRALATILSEQLRVHKKEQHIYYESALVENFPTVAMQTRLLAITHNKLSNREVKSAVRRFEEYKRAQLSEIIKKEFLTFNRTMEIYTKIASEIQGSAQNKIDFFSALNVKVTVDGWIINPTHHHLAYQIGPAQLDRIQTDDGPELKMPTIYSRGERTVMLLSESKTPFKESYYDVRGENLEHILTPERMHAIHAQLNANFISRLQTDGPVPGVDQVRYYYQRGLVVDPQQPDNGKANNEVTYKIRYNAAPTQVAVEPGKAFKKLIPHIDIYQWQKGLSTEAGRFMVALAHVIDQGKESKGRANDLAFLRERIHQCDPTLAKLTNEELLGVLEKRSIQGMGWIKQTDLDAKQIPDTYMDEQTINAQWMNIQAVDVLGYEQTGKYKHVGKGIKKRSKGREL